MFPSFLLKDSDALEEEGSFDYLAEGFEEASQMSEEIATLSILVCYCRCCYCYCYCYCYYHS